MSYKVLKIHRFTILKNNGCYAVGTSCSSIIRFYAKTANKLPFNSLKFIVNKPLNAFNEKKVQLVKNVVDKYDKYCSKYKNMSRMDDVLRAQEKVIQIQEELRLSQEERRALMKELMILRCELNNIQEGLFNCNKGDARYLDLVRQQYDTIRHEREKDVSFKIEDSKERELLTVLQSAVKESHKKEQSYSNTVKYWSIMLVPYWL